MISESDLLSAVEAGIIDQQTLDSLRGHANSLRATPMADEENFRLITSFNDLFVALAGILFFVGIGWIFGSMNFGIGALTVAAAAWGLSEFFTLKRRMAFPSIVFYLAFAWGILAAMLYFLGSTRYAFGSLMVGPDGETSGVSFTLSFAYLVLIGAAWAHWRRFKVPITVASGAMALVMLVATLVLSVAPNMGMWILAFTFLLGIGVFVYAMYWDMQDLPRKTRKSDVAFWLHLVASPLIVHSIFASMGINALESGVTGIGVALLAVLLYFVLGMVAVVVDRRAMLVSALAYVIVAIIYLFKQVGPSNELTAVAIVVIGSGLLILSAFWQNLRSFLFRFVPEKWKSRLPPVHNADHALRSG